MITDSETEVKTPAAAPKSAPTETALVPLSPENIEFGAGVVGGLAGFVVGGPLLAAILAAIANYSSKREGDAGDAVRGVAKSALETFNFLTGINSKYAVADKATGAFAEAVDKLKSTDDSKTIEKVEQTLLEATRKAAALSSEYDLVAKGKQALGVVGELADTAIDKTVELEKEYKV
ncbi:unnamed protein product, partial [Phaeothamnion confervicola]